MRKEQASCAFADVDSRGYSDCLARVCLGWSMGPVLPLARHLLVGKTIDAKCRLHRKRPSHIRGDALRAKSTLSRFNGAVRGSRVACSLHADILAPQTTQISLSLSLALNASQKWPRFW